jgi:hypothetical protein
MAFYTSTPEVPAVILYTKFQRENQAKNGLRRACLPLFFRTFLTT